MLSSRRLLSLALAALFVLSGAVRGASADQTRVVVSNDGVRITDARGQAPPALSRAKGTDAPLVWAEIDARGVFDVHAGRSCRLTSAPATPAFQFSDHTPTGCRPPPHDC